MVALGTAQDLLSSPAGGPPPVWRRGHEAGEVDESVQLFLETPLSEAQTRHAGDLRQLQRERDGSHLRERQQEKSCLRQNLARLMGTKVWMID